jgi:hypothetical protein
MIPKIVIIKVSRARWNGIVLFALSALSACTTTPFQQQGTVNDPNVQVLFEAATAIQDSWMHLPLRGTTEYRLTANGNSVAIRAVAKNSASGLIRPVDIDADRCPTLEWRWRVDRLQEAADLRTKSKEDVAASIFLLFGDPGFMTNPTPVPTLRYVWTNGQHQKDEVIDNPYLPGVVRSIVVRTDDVGSWHVEKRNIVRDYERAFGSPPKEPIHALALFTDNDQTREETVALYEWAKLYCRVQGMPILPSPRS